MSVCVSCGLQLLGDTELCSHHQCVHGADWAVGNRIMCDFFHRKKVPPRLTAAERDFPDDEIVAHEVVWPRTGAAA